MLLMMPASGNCFLKASSVALPVSSYTIILAASFCFQPSLYKMAHGQGGGGTKNMKVSSISVCWKIQCSKPLKRIASAGSEVKLVGNQSCASSMGYCRSSYLLRQLFWKLKSQWKQGLGWQKSYNRYSYDLQSYSLNFDNGFDDHR